MPDELQHPYFKRVDFMPVQNAAQRYIADDHLLGAGSFYRGPPLPDLDPLMRAGPFKGRDGPLAMPRQPFLTSTAPLPLGGRSELRQTFRSSVDQPLEAEYGDVGAFLREADNRLGVGDQGPKFHESPLENPLDALQLKHFDVSQSRTLRALRSQIDDDIVHPDDRAPLADPAQQGALQPGMDMSSRSTVLRSADGEFLLNSENEFGADKFEFKLKVAADPLRMQYERAAHVSKQHPATDLTLQPVITGGVCIGFRCSDGVVLAADTMLCQGSYQRFHDTRRLHKISDTIVMAADGEYSDFQEMQAMFQMYTEEHDMIEPQGVYRVYPSQALYFLHKVMYAKRCRMDPLWASVLIGGFDLRCGLDLPVVDEQDRAPEPFLGMVDMHGTPYEAHILTTGFGNYMALPLMRVATEEAERLSNQTQPKVLTMAEATRWAKDVMRVLSLRSSLCSSRIQIATVGEEGVDISAPFDVEGNWEIDGFFSKEKGNGYQPNATIDELWAY
eukprot:Tamp_10409.p1 GENE.Tamp_10409~~Tamp_10409.p1  ORF type:complete len:578 (+),score=139.23 Tamp_10409:231-1736(+)